jgi:hypothetical protein
MQKESPTPRSCRSLSYGAAASINSARAERRNDTDRLIAGCGLTPSLLPHSKGLRRRSWLHALKAAGRVQLSALLSDPVRHFARQCCPRAPRPIQSGLPQIVGELGRIKSYSSCNHSALRRLELTRQMRRYSAEIFRVRGFLPALRLEIAIRLRQLSTLRAFTANGDGESSCRTRFRCRSRSPRPTNRSTAACAAA